MFVSSIEKRRLFVIFIQQKTILAIVFLSHNEINKRKGEPLPFYLMLVLEIYFQETTSVSILIAFAVIIVVPVTVTVCATRFRLFFL